MKAMLSIDPGENIGVALWQFYEERSNEATEYPVSADAFLRFGRDWQPGVESSCSRFRDRVRFWLDEGYEITLAVMEYPAFFEDASVAAKSGNLVKLAMAAGAIWQSLSEMRIPVQFVQVRTWKGQMDKTATHHRIRKRLPDLDPEIKDHALDAVGIGLYVKGLF